MDGCEIRSHHFETMVETIKFVGIYRAIESFLGFLGGAKWISSTHSMSLEITRIGQIWRQPSSESDVPGMEPNPPLGPKSVPSHRTMQLQTPNIMKRLGCRNTSP